MSVNARFVFNIYLSIPKIREKVHGERNICVLRQKAIFIKETGDQKESWAENLVEIFIMLHWYVFGGR